MILLVSLFCLALAAFPSQWSQVSPTVTDFQLYDIITTAQPSVILRAGTDRDDSVYPLAITSSSLTGPFNATTLPFMEFSSEFNSIGSCMAYLDGQGAMMAVSAWPNPGGFIYKSLDGVNWVQATTFPESPLSLYAAMGTWVLTVNGGSAVRVSQDFGVSWTKYPVPYTANLGTQLVYGQGAWYLYRFDLGTSSVYYVGSTTDFQRYQNVTVASREASAPWSVVEHLLVQQGTLYAGVNDPSRNALTFYSSTAAPSWNKLASLAAANSTKLARIALCGSTAVVDHTGNRYVSTDGFRSFSSAPANPLQINVKSVMWGGQCSFVALGNHGYLATSTDGVNYQVVPNGVQVFLWTNAVFQAPDGFVAYGDNKMIMSQNGISWQNAPSPGAGVEFQTFYYSAPASQYVGVTSTGLFRTTSLSTPWQQQLMTAGIAGAAAGNGVWVYADGRGFDAKIYVSQDMNAGGWEPVHSERGSTIVPGPVYTSVVFVGGSFYVFAQIELIPKILQSADGHRWSVLARPAGKGCTLFVSDFSYQALFAAGDRLFLQCADEHEVFVYSHGAWKVAAAYPTKDPNACTGATASYFADTQSYALTLGPNVFYSTDGDNFAPGTNITNTANVVRYHGMAHGNGAYVVLGEFCDTAGGSFIFRATS